jgi:hypothetical protein
MGRGPDAWSVKTLFTPAYLSEEKGSHSVRRCEATDSDRSSQSSGPSLGCEYSFDSGRVLVRIAPVPLASPDSRLPWQS